MEEEGTPPLGPALAYLCFPVKGKHLPPKYLNACIKLSQSAQAKP